MKYKVTKTAIEHGQTATVNGEEITHIQRYQPGDVIDFAGIQPSPVHLALGLLEPVQEQVTIATPKPDSKAK